MSTKFGLGIPAVLVALALAGLGLVVRAVAQKEEFQLAQSPADQSSLSRAWADCLQGGAEGDDQRMFESCSVLIDAGNIPIDALNLAHNNRTGPAFRLGRSTVELADVTWLVEHDYGGVDMLINRANLLDRLGRFEAALEDYAEAIRQDPAHIRSYIQRAVAYRIQGKLELSLADLETARDLDPGNAEIYHRIAESYFAQGDLVAARANIERAIDLATDDPVYLLIRANLNELDGNPAAAAADTCRAYALAPSHPYVRAEMLRAPQPCVPADLSVIDVANLSDHEIASQLMVLDAVDVRLETLESSSVDRFSFVVELDGIPFAIDDSAHAAQQTALAQRMRTLETEAAIRAPGSIAGDYELSTSGTCVCENIDLLKLFSNGRGELVQKWTIRQNGAEVELWRFTRTTMSIPPLHGRTAGSVALFAFEGDYTHNFAKFLLHGTISSGTIKIGFNPQEIERSRLHNASPQAWQAVSDCELTLTPMN